MIKHLTSEGCIAMIALVAVKANRPIAGKRAKRLANPAASALRAHGCAKGNLKQSVLISTMLQSRSMAGALSAQQGEIVAAHQRHPGLHQANGSIAQIVGLPAKLGNAGFSKQIFCYRAIAVAFDSPIERAHREDESPAPLQRQGGIGRSDRRLLEGQP